MSQESSATPDAANANVVAAMTIGDFARRAGGTARPAEGASRQSLNRNRMIARIAFTPSFHVIFFPSS